MKKTMIHYSMIVASILLLIGCGILISVNNNNNSKRNATMSRTKTHSGLEYVILQEGSGAIPQPLQNVTVHYTGWLEKDGQPDLTKKFDSSIDRGEPFTFCICAGQVIKGWDDGVLPMKVGEKRLLYIPSNLAYGSRGAGRVIPPYANLFFEVELLSIS